ncbi:MAG TPA: ATP synthase F1 subunit delta [Acidimicrobiales bacterium]|nr:ATP synthase F1 subunit delta [Acidimicrobiales bacterium]
MNERVRGYAAAAFESAAAAGRLEEVVAELVELARALTRSSQLRQVLCDPGIEAATRAAIVGDLLEGGAAPSASLVAFAVRAENAREFTRVVAELVELGSAALDRLRSGAPAQPEPAASRALTRRRIGGYAERVLEELAAVGEVEEVEDELFRVARLVDDYPELRRALVDANAPYAARAAVVADLLSGRARPATVRLVSYVLRAGRVRDLVGTIEWLVELAALERGRRLAEVRAAVELERAEADRLAAALARLVGREVELRVVVDPSLVGGMLVRVGDLVIDGTLRQRFEHLRDLLAPGA